jgi:hypothetical protein
MRRLLPGFLRRFGYQIMVVGLVALIVVAGGYVLAVILPDLQRGTARPSAVPSPSATAGTLVMSWVNLPANADCAACHQTEGGVGNVTVPRIAHPLRGWTDCTACHANDRLVATAPGHAGIHATDCLICHEPADLPAPLSRPHREFQNQDCLTCHGKTEPLPEDMAHRAQSVCWLCHRLPDEQPPVPQHAIVAGQVDCLTCHVAGDVGALPADHASRTVSECQLCHVPTPGATATPTPSALPSGGGAQGLRWPLVFIR